MEIAHPVGNGDMRIAAHLGAANFYAGAGEAGQRICLAKKSPNVSRQRSATISECRAGDRCKLVEQFRHGCGVRRTGKKFVARAFGDPRRMLCFG